MSNLVNERYCAEDEVVLEPFRIYPEPNVVAAEAPEAEEPLDPKGTPRSGEELEVQLFDPSFMEKP